MPRTSSHNLIETIVELTKIYWGVGLAMSVVFGYATVLSLDWALDKHNAQAETIISGIAWMFYGLPVLFLMFTILLSQITIACDDYCSHYRQWDVNQYDLLKFLNIA
jgi:hypothetical protein